MDIIVLEKFKNCYRIGSMLCYCSPCHIWPDICQSSRLDDPSFSFLLKTGSVVNFSLNCVTVNRPGDHCVVGQNAHMLAEGNSETFACTGPLIVCGAYPLCVIQETPVFLC